jgi:hypothetical protein
MTDQTLEKIKAAKQAAQIADGNLLVVETDIVGAEAAAFRVPNRGEWKRYTTERASGDASLKVNAFATLVYATCIFPPIKEFEAIIDGHPGLIETYHGELIEHAGANQAKKVTKL